LTDDQLDKVHSSIREALISFEDCIEFVTLYAKIATRAERLCATTGIGATDALHLATAMYKKCDIFVTNDDDFLDIVKRNNYMLVCKSNGFNNTYNEYMGLRPITGGNSV